MDRRIAKSKRAIYGAFKTLLDSHPYPEITVEMVLGEAKVARSTFYAHFKNKDDVIFSLSDHIVSHVFDSKHTIEDSHDLSYSSYTYDPEVEITHLFYHFRDDKGLFVPIIRSQEARNILLPHLRERFAPFFDHLALTRNYRKEGVPSGITSCILLESFIGLLLHWLEKDCLASPEGIASYYCKSFRYKENYATRA